MSAETLIANLIRIAKEDLDGARTLHARGNGNAVDLCAQAAEKIVLAVLTAEGLHAGNHRRLEHLVALVPEANSIKPMLRAVEHLTAFAAANRGPNASGRDLLDVLERTSEVLEVVVLRFQVDLDARDVPARRPGPIR